MRRIYVGSVLQKAYLRFLGTLFGCLFAVTILLTLGNSNLAIMITIGLSSFIFSYLATGQESLSYAGTLGAATAAIIMLSQPPTLLIAFERFLEISIGILIATIVSQFILPIHARTHLKRAQATTLEQLRDYYLATLTSTNALSDSEDYHHLDENIVKSLLKQRQLASESKHERLRVTFDQNHFSQTLYYEREMLRAMTFMSIALTRLNTTKACFTQSPSAQPFHNTILQSLNTLIEVVKSNSAAEHHIHVPSLQNFQEERQKNAKVVSVSELIDIDGFLFSAGILATNVAKIAALYHIPITHSALVVDNTTE